MNFCKTQTIQLSPVLSFQYETLTNTQTSSIYLSIPFGELLPKIYQAIVTSSENLGASYVGSSDFMWEDNHKIFTLQFCTCSHWHCQWHSIPECPLKDLQHHWSLKGKFQDKEFSILGFFTCAWLSLERLQCLRFTPMTDFAKWFRFALQLSITADVRLGRSVSEQPQFINVLCSPLMINTGYHIIYFLKKVCSKQQVKQFYLLFLFLDRVSSILQSSFAENTCSSIALRSKQCISPVSCQWVF